METTEILKKVRKIEIKTRGLSSQIFSGHYHSAFKGKGMAFSEVREYQFGDDIRSIDWNVTARFNHPYVKVFEEERELTVMLLIDVSGSNEFGTQQQLKEEIMTEISAVLAFSALNIRELIDFKPESQKTDISDALRFLTNAIKKKCIAFLISDFFDDEFEPALKIASRKHDLVALRIFDNREATLPSMGLVKVFNKESQRYMWIDTSDPSLRRNYEHWWNKQEKYLESTFKRLGIDNASISTGQDYVRPLMGLFKRREARF